MANLNAPLTCPHCRHRAHELMPTDRCIVVYQCPNCARSLRPKKGDCCVFCSYADRTCPPKQDSSVLGLVLYSAKTYAATGSSS